MMNMIRRAWFSYRARCHEQTVAECNDLLAMPGVHPDAACALMLSKISAQVELLKAQAVINGMRENDGADYAILVALLVMLAWGYVSEMDYRDIAAGSAHTCIYRGN